MRWLSPERMKGGQLTWKCDVYSFGMVIYEVRSEMPISLMFQVYTEGSIPLDHVDDVKFRKDIMRGTRPARPDQMPEGIWQLTTRCWAQDPKLRPKFSTITKEIERMYNPGSIIRKDTAHTGMSQ